MFATYCDFLIWLNLFYTKSLKEGELLYVKSPLECDRMERIIRLAGYSLGASRPFDIIRFIRFIRPIGEAIAVVPGDYRTTYQVNLTMYSRKPRFNNRKMPVVKLLNGVKYENERMENPRWGDYPCGFSGLFHKS